MAYTVPVLDATPEALSIYTVDPSDLANDAPHWNPLTAANLPRTMFHSSLPYYKALIDQSLTWTLPARNSSDTGTGTENIDGYPYQYFDHSPFTATALSAAARGFMSCNSQYSVVPLQVQQTGGVLNRRLVVAKVATTGLLVREYWYKPVSTSWAGIALTLRGVAFERVTATSGADVIDLNGATNTYQMGKLLIDAASSGRLMRESATGIPVTPDRSIDLSSTGVRVWNVYDGSYADLGTYTGSYAGPTRRFIA